MSLTTKTVIDMRVDKKGFKYRVSNVLAWLGLGTVVLTIVSSWDIDAAKNLLIKGFARDIITITILTLISLSL